MLVHPGREGTGNKWKTVAYPPTIQSLMAVQWLLVHSGCQLQMHTNHHYYHHPKYINVLNKHIYTVYTVYYIVCYAFYPSLDS